MGKLFENESKQQAGNKPVMVGQPITIDQIPDNQKEQIKCTECGRCLFEERFRVWKIRDKEGRVNYGRVSVLVCAKCGREVPDMP
jgi:DNA-directed RNA polymerase subunit RPC12/RpoP